MAQDLYLAIDIGTGSARAALVDFSGRIQAIAAQEYDQIVPQYGWSEQRPLDWWAGVVSSIRQLLAKDPGTAARIAAICACGQMHGTVLLDANGELTRDAVPLWNDKRTAALVKAFEATYQPADYLAQSANPATPAWPGFKLQWLRDEDAAAYDAARAVVMPKDYVNFRLTGEIAMDRTEAACSFLMDPASGAWSPHMCDMLGLDIRKLVAIRQPTDILGAVSKAAAAETGLPVGVPVMIGGGDFPVALLGSGVSRAGLCSDVTGTSAIITVVAEKPLLDPEISNIGTVEGGWGGFVLLESGGDSMRWARRAFHEKALSYEEIVAKAETAPPGSERLFFLPYLTGERFGAHRNSRAQFFGITAEHGMGHLHRAVMEGVAFAVTRQMRIMEQASGRKLERVIASGGGAKTPLWLKIKASAYNIPILVPEEAECGVVGCAAIAAAATGRFAKAEDAAEAFVHYKGETLPDPAWADIYQRMQPVFNRLYQHSQALYDDLDALKA
ncbi:xylulokinase [Dongia rigui]|uniref:FGGY family carbohydrate kinase n=1 Tax=Dongia rigui TaxID=940149 RepID=A0ABU5E234_9PROT|nr:FGGY family carbohydrate kinase [Dongia rigui]MDY0873564.1 FGGY family carbohydrate kinase [Dongia rigui]